eukprot:scaffold62550_cov60-Phaeocystis_antarctica.AAC.11
MAAAGWAAASAILVAVRATAAAEWAAASATPAQSLWPGLEASTAAGRRHRGAQTGGGCIGWWSSPRTHPKWGRRYRSDRPPTAGAAGVPRAACGRRRRRRRHR